MPLKDILNPEKSPIKKRVQITAPVGSAITVKEIQDRLVELFEDSCDQFRRETNIAADNYSLAMLLAAFYEAKIKIIGDSK